MNYIVQGKFLKLYFSIGSDRLVQLVDRSASTSNKRTAAGSKPRYSRQYLLLARQDTFENISLP